ncbi:MAG: hypothetical protein IIW62_04605, partial [Selenomonadales bacterium]|nr:hypothetical protein [Selenomonadales bacterium]
DTAAEAYNHSVIPIAAPSIDNKLTQDNQVVVSSTGRGESVRHIDISADTGKESIREMTGTYTWYGGGTDQDVSYVGTSEGQEAKYKTASNTVRVDGTLIAGTNDVQNVVISGNVAPPNSVAANGSGDSEYTITLNGAAMEGATVTTMDYGNVLFDRYQETTKLMNEYYGKYEESGSEKDLSAYLGYKAEQERIFAQMEKAGLTVSVTKDGVTMTYPIEVDGNYIHVVELPDIVSSGGNINIDTDTLYGQGSFDAHGTPEINIKNESTAYLKLNDLTIGEVGGDIVYNGQSIGDNGNDMIAGLNRDKSKTVNFAAIMADGEVGDAAVFVHSTNTGAMQIRPEGQANAETHSWTPIKTIEIGGVIENLLGTVTITNDAGDIIIQNDDNTAGIEARIVKLTATGAVAQGFTDGIVNIGGDPTSQWSDIADQKQEDARLDLDNSGHENETHGMMGADLPEAEAENGNWIVGGEVYINASDINVNGTIQSGFDRYQVTIPEDAVDNIDYNDASKIEYINGNKVYKINDGNKTVRRDNGKYAYEVQAYYDPSTDKIIIDDITTQGGKIYLTGRISSTGNGKIVALDGGADINIESFSDKTLVIGKIDNSEAVGLIRITDLNKMTETEYTRNSTKVTDLKTNGVETTTGDNTNTNYSVQEGLRYNWTTGTETVEKKTYHKESTEDWWGLGKADVTEELERYEETHSPTEVVSGSGDKPQGAYIDRVDEIGADGKDYVIIYDNDMKSEEHSEVEQWKSTSGFLGWYQTNHYRWTVTTGSSQTYQHSVKADRPIDIGFIDGGSDQQIYIRGQKDVDLTGTIISANADSSMDITAFRGTLSQADGTTLVADSIKLDAETGIAGIDITAMKQTDLSRNVDVIMQTVSGDIDVTVDGNVTVNRAKTGEGSIVLSATGDILKGSETVIADRIDLVSGGKIDLIVNGGQDPRTDDSMSASVSAQAKGNITLTEEDGDMRIGTIVSQEGDVTLTAKNGSIVDVIPTDDISDTPDTAVRIQRWQDLGLIEGDGEYIYERQEDANDYRESITEAYAYYAEQKAYYESAPSEQKSELYLKLAEQFDGYASADAFLADSLQYQELTETLTAEDYDWTKEQLLYAIHESVINKTSATHQDKVANITGKNITLKAENGSIGIDLDTAEVVSLKGLSSNVDALKKVANAENSDVLWFEGADDPYIDENGTAHYDVVVINHQKPLGIAASGTVKADAKADIFLAGRETSMDNISDSLYETLTVDHIISQNGDVRIIGERALRAATSSTLHIQGQDVILEGGKKGIGTADNAVYVQVGDELTARSEGDLYIEQKDGDLTVLTMYAAGDAVLSAGGDILAGEDDSGYINVRGELTLRAGGDIGTSAEGLRVMAGGTAVDATADNIYLDGRAESLISDHALVLRDITAEDIIDIQSESDIKTVGTIKATNAALGSDKNIELAEGKIEADTAILQAGKQLVQSADHTVHSTTTDATAKNGIALDGENNRLGTLFLDNEEGTVRVNNTDTLRLYAEENAGDIIVTNKDDAIMLMSDLTAHNITLDNTNGDIVLGSNNVTADSDITI